VIFIRAIVLMCAAALAGCFPAISTIHEPDAAEGRLRGESCHGGSGTYSVLALERKGIGVEVKAFDPAGRISIIFHVPEGVTAILASDVVELRPHESSTIDRYKVDHLWSYAAGQRTELRFDTPLVGSTKKYPAVSYHERYGTQLKTRPLPDRFFLRLPPIRANNTTVEFPEISFTKKTVVAIHSLNC
jgi:hypothetical protein